MADGAPRPIKLVVLDGPLRGLGLEVAGNEAFVGRDRQAEIRLPLDPEVAPFHCRLSWQAGEWRVEELENATGTRLGGRTLRGAERVRPGDVLRVGGTRLALAAHDADVVAVLDEHAAPVEPAGGAPALDRGLRLLVIDDDQEFLVLARRLLRTHGHHVVTASSGPQALARLADARPDAIVCDVMMPGMDGWTLVEKLRSIPEQVSVPVLFVTGHPGERARAFGMGADDCLTKDRLDELEMRIRGALARRVRIGAALAASAGTAPGDAASGVRGSLDLMGLPALLTMLEMERKSGVLEVTHPERGMGRIEVREGRPVRARAGAASGPEAIYTLLGWPDGEFAFVAGDVGAGDEVRLDAMHLLMEAARLQDERQRGPGGVPD